MVMDRRKEEDWFRVPDTPDGMDQKVRAIVGESTVFSKILRGAGVYNLRITRESAFTAHCEGTICAVSIFGEVLWRIEDWRSDKDGVDFAFSVPTDEIVLILFDMQAHHFTSAVAKRGSSVVRVRFTRTGPVKSKFCARTKGIEIRGVDGSQARELPQSRKVTIIEDSACASLLLGSTVSIIENQSSYVNEPMPRVASCVSTVDSAFASLSSSVDSSQLTTQTRRKRPPTMKELKAMLFN